ncbi:MAG: hypothetical protein ACYSR9_09535 [Planctomycetota bacterium]|jgi:hypothetical protein
MERENINIEEILKKIGGEDVPADVQAIAEVTSREFSGTLLASGRPVLWKHIMKSRITSFAAAAVIIIAVVSGVYHFGDSVDVASIAFGDVLEQIYNARSVTYKQTFYVEDNRPFTSEIMIIESGIMRSVLPHGDVLIFDSPGGKNLHLMVGQKRAILTHRVGRSKGKRLFNYLDWVSKMHAKGGEFTGREEVNGEIANVFVVQESQFEKATVWVNPESNLPIRIERVMVPNPDENVIVPRLSLSTRDFGDESNNTESRVITISSGRGSGKGIHRKMKLIMSDFIWNEELDASLFSTDAPEGYTLEERQFDDAQPDEKDLIYALGFWAEMSDGSFPSEINGLADPNKIRPMLIAKFDKDRAPKEELDHAMKEVNKILKGLFFVQRLKVEGSWGYAGNGVQLGDADTPICWWKVDGSEDYRVVYGDLSIGNLAAADLPELP